MPEQPDPTLARPGHEAEFRATWRLTDAAAQDPQAVGAYEWAATHKLTIREMNYIGPLLVRRDPTRLSEAGMAPVDPAEPWIDGAPGLPAALAARIIQANSPGGGLIIAGVVAQAAVAQAAAFEERLVRAARDRNVKRCTGYALRHRPDLSAGAADHDYTCRTWPWGSAKDNPAQWCLGCLIDALTERLEAPGWQARLVLNEVLASARAVAKEEGPGGAINPVDVIRLATALELYDRIERIRTAAEPVAEVEEAVAAEETLTVSRELLEALVSSDECSFDHHGGCQTHNYLSLEPGQLCPQAELKELLKA